jgi:hypothetical protein
MVPILRSTEHVRNFVGEVIITYGKRYKDRVDRKGEE